MWKTVSFRLCLWVKKKKKKKEGVRQKEQLNYVPLSWQQLVSWLLWCSGCVWGPYQLHLHLNAQSCYLTGHQSESCAAIQSQPGWVWHELRKTIMMDTVLDIIPNLQHVLYWIIPSRWAAGMNVTCSHFFIISLRPIILSRSLRSGVFKLFDATDPWIWCSLCGTPFLIHKHNHV